MEDPTKISSRQEKQVKKFVKDYFDKAVLKHREREKRKAEKKAKEGDNAVLEEVKKEEESDGDQDMAMSDDDDDEEEKKPKVESTTPITPMDQTLSAEGLKRKREEDENVKAEGEEATPSKRLKSETPPPPPPPPPAAPANGVYPSPVTMSNGDEDAPEYTPADMYHDEEAPSYGASPEGPSVSSIHPPPPPPPSGSSRSREILHDGNIGGDAQTPDAGDTDVTPGDCVRGVDEHERPFSPDGAGRMRTVQA